MFVRVVPDDAQALLGREVADLPVPAWTPDGPRLGCEASQRAVAWQMLTCPADAPGRSLYLSAKGLELLASLALPSRDPAPLGLAGTQRLYEARDILLATLEAPPSVPELARAVGLSARSLSRGFSRLFGQPVYAFVKARRLERARRLIETDALTIAEAAYAIGYHPSHLSTAFRRHFGVAPSALRPPR
ncbi:helix-turn-helix transcriptional regulator [Pararhodospirillum photometricum]|uniref:Transcriptional regulator, AraC family n=1 Tax=Pararhodospirillum photometricum DSM 122 TaxID=1150469 RepID=H6SS92_PARPM|nr:AraC family transcriptional regulator [Pararhodospirillum photometricum]CCG07771.1 Transcriptional regulator, AraC family [Pararhodospirillum photometricum DSM 122]